MTCAEDPRHVHARRTALPLVPDRERRRTLLLLPSAGGRTRRVRPRRQLALDRGGRVARGRCRFRLEPLARGGRGREGLATAALRALRGLFGELALRRSSSARRRRRPRDAGDLKHARANLRRLESQWAGAVRGGAGFTRRSGKSSTKRHAPSSREASTAIEASEWNEVTDRYRDKKLQPYPRRASRSSWRPSRASGRRSWAGSRRAVSCRPRASLPRRSWRSAGSTSSSFASAAALQGHGRTGVPLRSCDRRSRAEGAKGP